MKVILKLLMALLMALFIGNQAISQVGVKGAPASFAYSDPNAFRSSETPLVAPVNFDVQKLLAEDRIAKENNAPLRTAMVIPVELNAKNSGEWTTLPNGQQIWRLTVHAPDAIAIMLYYDEFIIPEGGKLFIYNEDHTHVIGAYTNLTNPSTGAFATEFVAGDKITLEYNAPPDASAALFAGNILPHKPAMPQIKISGIGYGCNYLKINRNEYMFRAGESASFCAC
jgi:hypothetical protein